jgi:hypothetical protein
MAGGSSAKKVSPDEAIAKGREGGAVTTGFSGAADGSDRFTSSMTFSAEPAALSVREIRLATAGAGFASTGVGFSSS